MTFERSRCCRGFSLLEIMIIVGLIGLLIVMALPTYIKVRKQAQGRRIVNDARNIDTAIDTWAMEYNKIDGDSVDLDGLSPYVKAGTVYPNDALGNPFGIGPVGLNQVRISTATKDALSGVTIDWGAY